MQYISNQGNNFNHIQILVALLSLIWLFFWKGEVICRSKTIRFMLFFNPLTISQCLKKPIQMTECVAGIMYFLSSISTQVSSIGLTVTLKVLVTVWLVYKNPIMMPLIIMSEQCSKQWRNRKIKNLYMVVLGSLSIFSILELKKSEYFSEHFEKNSGLMWMLYSHIFSRYLKLYQTILILTPFILLMPLSLSTSRSTVKIAVTFYASIFVSPNVTPSQLLLLYAFQSCLYSQMAAFSTKKNLLIWRVLTVMCAVITIPAYLFYERVSYLWLNTQMVSVGYFLLHLLLFWGTHAVYLAQGMKMIDEQDQQEKAQKGILEKLKLYILNRLQNL